MIFFRRDDRRYVFHEIDAAFVAGAGMLLLMCARGAGEEKRGVASWAKARSIRRGSAAF